jgi:hypothetical protein
MQIYEKKRQIESALFRGHIYSFAEAVATGGID